MLLLPLLPLVLLLRRQVEADMIIATRIIMRMVCRSNRYVERHFIYQDGKRAEM